MNIANNQLSSGCGRKAYQPTSRFNYEIDFDKTPSNYKTYDLLDSAYEHSAFTFEQSNHKRQGYYGFSQFDPRDDTSELIAKNLIEENILLKEQLLKSRQLVSQLQTDLKACQRQLLDLTKMDSMASTVIAQLRDEIYFILNQNKVIENQLHIVKSSLPFLSINRSPLQSTSLSDIQMHKLNRSRSNSLDFKGGKRKVYITQFSKKGTSLVQGKGQQLLNSIQNMYFKIIGARPENLKDLWRWLKQLGYSYSQFKKWKPKIQSELGSTEPQIERLQEWLRGILDLWA